MNRIGTLFLSTLLATAAAFAADPSTEESDGALLYRVHCASCHGLDARGDGPMREVLKVAPTDLTRLQVKHDGVFPRDHARESIDGRGEIAGHGSREMPVWGLTFQVPGRAENQEDETRQRIDALLRYLDSLQAPDD